MIGAKAINAALGLWLFFSGFLWQHTPAQRWNAWLVGMAAVGFALADLYGKSWARHVTLALGAWLVLTATLLPRTGMATFWNCVAVGFGLLLSSIMSDERLGRATRRARVRFS